MIRRPVGSDFAADVYVFPGGKVDPADSDPELARVCTGYPRNEIDTDTERIAWQALRMAAIRELFEEVGVLVAECRDGVDRLETTPVERLAAYRRQLHGAHLTMLQLAEQEDLVYPLDRLHAIARWITPESLSRRFDTMFFVAEIPEGQAPQPHFRETSHGLWIAPARALERFHARSFPLVFATERNLQLLAEYESIEGLIASTSSSSLDPIMPRMVLDRGETRFLLPGDEGYDSR